MSFYLARLVDGQPVRYSIEELKRDNPDTSFPKDIPDERLADWGIIKVAVDPRPPYDSRTQFLTKIGPTEVSPGEWSVSWSVDPLPQDEVDALVDKEITKELAQNFGKIFFRLANEIQALKGQPALTPAQFKNWYKQQVGL